ncbi:MAG: hypothetical protein AAF391_04920, partial [Bacteroidota bacterium]
MLAAFTDLFLEWEIILVFSGLLGLIWSLFLLTHKRGNRLANKFLEHVASKEENCPQPRIIAKRKE